MLRKSTIWYLRFLYLTTTCLFNNLPAARSQGTGVINLNVVTTPASCFNTNGMITINATGGTAPYLYSIDNGASYQATGVFTGLDSALYQVMVKDANGITATDAVRLTALPTPKVYIGSDTVVCAGSVLFLAVPQEAGYSYIWDDGSTGFSYAVTQAGAYSVKVTNQYGCYASTSINVLVRPTTLFSLGNDTTLCYGRDLQLKPMPALQGSYLWSNGSSSPTLTIHTPGVYWLKVTDSVCVKRDSIRVSYKLNPQVSLGTDTALCIGQTLLLDATVANSVYIWQDGSTNSSFLVNQPGVYSVKVAGNGCDTTVQLTVSYITKPPKNLIKDTTVCIKQLLILDASYPNSTYQWQDGSVLPQFTVTTAGTYAVLITGQCGTTTDSATVKFDNCDCIFYVPNAFTPNGDGKNDIFLPKYHCLLNNYELKVFNRWGQLVFESRNPAVGWDGSYGNRQQETGTYIWELNYEDNLTGKNMRKTGTITLIQ